MKIQSKSEFSKNVLTLMTGTTIAQAIPIAISPILTRLYTPEDFGVFALFLSISSLLVVVSTGRYELAIMIPRKDSDASNIAILSIMIAVVISLFSLLIVTVFNYRITSFLENKEISNWLYFIPVTVFLTGIYQSLNYWFNRQKKYRILGKNRVIKSATNSGVNIAIGLSTSGSSGLVMGSIIGQFISTGILAKMFFRDEKQRIMEVKIVKIIAMARKYIHFPKINMFHAFLDMAKGFAVNIFLVKFYDTFTLGQFYMVNRILFLPSSLIGTSISQVLFRELAEKYNKKEEFSKIVLGLMIKLFLFALIPFLAIVFFSKPFFIFIFGENWAVAGELAAAFSPYVLFHFVASPLSIVPLVVNKQIQAFNINLIGMGIYVSSLVIGYFVFGTLVESLHLLSILTVIYFLFYYFWIYKISNFINK